MGRMSRNKGKRGEREVLGVMQTVIDRVSKAHGLAPMYRLQRNTMQSDGGGYDLHGVPWLAPEIKRVERLQVSKWWRQACGQANDRQMPVLLWRQNKGEWHARVRDARGTRDMDLREFMRWFERHLIADAMDRDIPHGTQWWVTPSSRDGEA